MITKGADKYPSDPIFYLLNAIFLLFKCLLVIIRGSNDRE